MKEFLTLLFLLVPILMICAQQPFSSQSASNIPNGFSRGSVLTPDSVRHDGYIKDNIKYRSEIILLRNDGQKITYNAQQLLEARIDSNCYRAISDEWYKVIAQGNPEKNKGMNLLRKASAGAGRIAYNGAEPVIIPTVQGSFNDYFLQPVAGHKLTWVSKMGFEKIVQAAFADCPELVVDMKNRKLQLADLSWLVTRYNNCQ